MNLRKRLTSLLLLTALLLPCLCALPLPSHAADASPTAEKYTRKIVSVLYDNSGSMSYDQSGDYRQYYAEYSMQMLMALLSPNDLLFITPMNSDSDYTDSKDDSLTDKDIDLSNPNRQSVIDQVMSKTSFFKPSGGTPGQTIQYAVEHLRDNGLKDKNNLASAEDNVEHWLIVMTDGEMSINDWSINVESNTKTKTEKIIEKYIKDYPSLKTIYMTFGAGISLEGSSLESKYAFTAYKADSPSGVTDVMQKIANQISGRFPYAATNYTVNGSTVTVDLGSLPYALKSISVVAQNCGVTLKTATYQGKNLSLLSPCVISPASKLNMKDGYTAKIEGDPYFTEGKLTLNFSGPVDQKKLSILVEPALEIRTYFERWNNNRWERVTAQFVNENLTKNDRLRVGYELFELSKPNEPLNMDKIFSPNEAKVTYCGKEYKVTNCVTEELELETGVHEIAIAISVLDGAYKLYDSVLCAIMDNPKAYYLDIDCKELMSNKETSTEATCAVYYDNRQVTGTNLNGYTCTAKVTAPNGTVRDLPATIKNNRFCVTVTPTSGLYGNYTVYFKVIAPASLGGVYREKTHTLKYAPLVVGVNAQGPDTITHGTTSADVRFTPTLSGDVMSAGELALFHYEVKATRPDGQEIPITQTVSDSTVTARLKVEENYFGIYTLTYRIWDDSGTEATKQHTVAYHPASLTIKGDYLDAMPAGETKTSFVYTVIMNGTPLITKAEVEKYSYTFSLTDPLGRPVTCTGSVGADGKITFPIDLSSTGYGNYNATFTFTVDDGCKAEDNHTLSNFPETLAVVPAGGNNLSMSEQQLIDGGKSVEFNLLLNGQPASFATGGIVYRLMAGNKDVTASAIVNGDKLVYTPSVADIGSTHGDRELKLHVYFDGAPGLSDEASVTITITQTTYLVEIVPLGNRDIDRFALSEVSAVLYFRVSRDGMPLTLDQLQDALDRGELHVADGRGTFTWQLWLPTGYQTEALSVGTEALLAVRATRDWIKPLDSFAAMLIFNGDKPISVSYGGAEATDSFRFTPSPAWEYIWRILVILLLIYITLYIIGFFNGKCRSLPAGVILQISAYQSKKEEVSSDTIPVNETFFKHYGWHIRRFFIPFHKGKFLWYHQPAQNLGGVVIMECNEDGVARLVFEHSEMYPLTANDDGSEAADLFFRTMIPKARNGEDLSSMDPKVRSGELRDLLYREAEVQNIQENKQASTNPYYGMYENGRTLNYVLKFLSTK